MKIINKAPITVILLLTLSPLLSFGLRESHPLAVDKRLRVIVYNPNDVFKYTGFYGYESSIVFEADEQIGSITMGDSISWQIAPNANRIFLKPIEQEATTNMTVISDKRVYHFELHAEEAENINDPDLVFSVKFIYPDDGNSSSAVVQFGEGDSLASDIASIKNKNLNYTISGPEEIAPTEIFDDGSLTYIHFSKIESEMPTIFLVYPDKTEGLINYTVNGKYLVIEKVAERFTIRSGTQVGCIFNEKLIAYNKKLNKDDSKQKASINKNGANK